MGWPADADHGAREVAEVDQSRLCTVGLRQQAEIDHGLGPMRSWPGHQIVVGDIWACLRIRTYHRGGGGDDGFPAQQRTAEHQLATPHGFDALSADVAYRLADGGLVVGRLYDLG